MLNFQTLFVKHLAFPHFCQFQMNIDMVAENMLVFAGMKFQVATV